MSIAAATNALITLATYKVLVGVEDDNQHLKEDQVNLIINATSQVIEDYCNRKFILPIAVIVEQFDGDGSDTYWVRQNRIAATPVPILEWRSGDTWTAIDIGTNPYEYDTDEGRIWFTSNLTFGCGTRNWRITYKYGWAQALLPADLQAACGEMVQRQLKLLTGKQGVDSESTGDQTTGFNLPTSLPNNIKNVVDRYRRQAIG